MRTLAAGVSAALVLAALSWSAEADACQPPPAEVMFVSSTGPLVPSESAERLEARPGGTFWLLGDVAAPLVLADEDGDELVLSTVAYRSEHWTAFAVPTDAPPGRYTLAGERTLQVVDAPPPAPLPLTLGTPVVEADEQRTVSAGCSLLDLFLPVEVHTRPVLRVRVPLPDVTPAEAERLRLDAWVVPPGETRDDDELPRHADAWPLEPPVSLGDGELLLGSERREPSDLLLRLVDERTGARGDVVVVRLDDPGEPKEEQMLGLLAMGCAAAVPSGGMPFALFGLALLLWRRGRRRDALRARAIAVGPEGA